MSFQWMVDGDNGNSLATQLSEIRNTKLETRNPKQFQNYYFDECENDLSLNIGNWNLFGI